MELLPAAVHVVAEPRRNDLGTREVLPAPGHEAVREACVEVGRKEVGGERAEVCVLTRNVPVVPHETFLRSFPEGPEALVEDLTHLVGACEEIVYDHQLTPVGHREPSTIRHRAARVPGGRRTWASA